MGHYLPRAVRKSRNVRSSIINDLPISNPNRGIGRSNFGAFFVSRSDSGLEAAPEIWGP